MALMKDNEFVQTKFKKFESDGFVIENGIIKGVDVCSHSDAKDIGEVILSVLNRNLERIGQIDAITGKKRTFRDIKERSIRLAIWLRKEGIKPGDIVSLCLPNHPDVETIIYATLLIGATYNAFPYAVDLTSLRSYIQHIQPQIIFGDKNKIHVLQKAAELKNYSCKMIVLDRDSNYESLDDILKIQSSDEMESFRVTKQSKNICIIMPTSGTSAVPKFVCYSYEKLMYWLATGPSNYEPSNENNIKLTYLFPEWNVHYCNVLSHLFYGDTQIFHKDFDPYETSRIIEKYKVNELIMNTYKVLTYCNFYKIHKYDLKSISSVKSTGSQLPVNTVEKMRKIFPNAFHSKMLGMTEAGAITTYTRKCRNPQSQGTVITNVQLKIMDVETGRTLGPNKVGEICIKSPYIMTCYYKNPTATEAMYDNEGWFHTGDEAYYDENGEIIFIGRLKETIKYRDTDIHAAYVEQILLSHPDIIEAAVIGIPHDLNGEQPVAYIKKTQGSKITEEDVLKLTNGFEYNQAFKNSIIFIDDIPHTTNGKVNKRLLLEQAKKIYQLNSHEF